MDGRTPVRPRLRLRQHAHPVEMSDHAATGVDADQQRIARRELHLAAGQPTRPVGAAQRGAPLALPLQAQVERAAPQQAPAYDAELPLDYGKQSNAPAA